MAKRQPAQDLNRDQKLQACEVALQGVQQNDERILRWFVSDIMHLPWSWRTVATLALLDRDKAGEYRWRKAKNPLGLLRTISRRSAAKDYPELLNGSGTGVAGGTEVPVSSLHVPGGGYRTPRGDREDDRGGGGGGSWHDEFIERASFEADDFAPPPIWDELKWELFSNDGRANSLALNWREIGQRLGFTEEQTEMLVAKARGVARSDMAAVLGWDTARVERVWKAIYRRFSSPEMKDRVRRELLAYGQ